jgi:hypothetical protein
MIVTGFAKGDRRQLRSLLSREAYNRFDTAITEREGRGEIAETRFVSIDGSTVTAAELRDRTAQITVRFVSKLFSATRDRSGTVIDGNAEKVTDNTEVWTFARNISSRDPNWKIVADRSRTVTPMPICVMFCGSPRRATTAWQIEYWWSGLDRVAGRARLAVSYHNSAPAIAGQRA